VVLSRYRHVLGQPHVARLLVTSMLARLPQGMSSLAILLFLAPRLGYGRAGLATGVTVAAAGVSSVVLARAVDRVGARIVLGPSAALYAAALLWLAAAGHSRYGVQLAICAISGLVTPPVTAVARGMWPSVVGEEQAQLVYGLEATAQEFIYIAGPAVIALIAGLVSARVAVIVTGLTGLAGALSYISAAPFATTARAAAPDHRGGILRGTGILRYTLVGVFIVLGFSMTDIATVDFVGGRGASPKAGVVLAIWSAGSLVGGLLFGTSKHEVTDRSLARTAGLVALGLAAAALSPDAVGLAVILFCSGGAIAPTLARLYTRMGTIAPQGRTTESFGWLAVGFLAGGALGSTFGGAAVDAVGSRWTLVLSGLALLCAALIAGAPRPVPSLGVRRQAPDPDAA
jgi:MFS family permease